MVISESESIRLIEPRTPQRPSKSENIDIVFVTIQWYISGLLRIFMPLPVEDFNYFFLLTKQRATCHIFLYDAFLISVAILVVSFAIVVGGEDSK